MGLADVFSSRKRKRAWICESLKCWERVGVLISDHSFGFCLHCVQCVITAKIEKN